MPQYISMQGIRQLLRTQEKKMEEMNEWSTHNGNNVTIALDRKCFLLKVENFCLNFCDFSKLLSSQTSRGYRALHWKILWQLFFPFVFFMTLRLRMWKTLGLNQIRFFTNKIQSIYLKFSLWTTKRLSAIFSCFVEQSSIQVSISPTFYVRLFCTKVLCEAFCADILGLSLFFGPKAPIKCCWNWPHTKPN